MRPVLLALLALGSASRLTAAPPNVVVILADDLGYGDLGCYGSPTVRTPHLDRMAAEGLRFTDFYAGAEVCTPSRAALLTGRYPIRSGMCGPRRVLFPDSPGGLPASEVTLAEALKGKGYATACVGKWHLGHHPQHLPTRHGFDEYFGLPYSNDMDPTPTLPKGGAGRESPDWHWWNPPLLRNEAVVERPADQTTLTRRYADEAVGFIKKSKGRPFFLYLAHTFPHVPLFASPDFHGKSRRGRYGDVVEELDAAVGRVLDALRAEGLASNTLVWFTSDNGPWLAQKLAGGSAGPLREGKGSTWEGGVRVPGIAWWPGSVKPGVTAEVACAMDLFATGVRLAGAEVPADRPIDGIDLSGLLRGTGGGRAGFLYYRGAKLFAARVGPWKAHFHTQAGYGQPQPADHDPPLLYHLGRDPGEAVDVARDHPEALAEVAAAVRQHRAGLTPGESQLGPAPKPKPE